jgi:hypothetical protein
VGELVNRITDDVKTIASDELQLAKIELTRGVKTAVGEAAVVVLGGIVALVGFAMLCVVAVVALAPVIPALWLRLLIMAAVYLVAGGAIAGVFAKKLAKDIRPDLSDTVYEAKKTVQNVKEGLKA